MADAGDRIRAVKDDLRVPDGIWRVDPERSEVGFAVKSVWGLVTVRGVFAAHGGSFDALAGNAVGDLTIDAASVDTGNARRDNHLRSSDFFDVERYPQIVFKATVSSAGSDGVIVVGDLAIGSSRTRLEIPVEVKGTHDDGLTISGETRISRTAVGVTWNKLGAVADDVKVDARIKLSRGGL
jgi:polyisoprenoid-binding protein YceI